MEISPVRQRSISIASKDENKRSKRPEAERQDESLNIGLKFENASGIDASKIHVVINGYNSDNLWGYYDLSKEPAGFTVTEDMSAVPDTALDILLSREMSTIGYISSGRVYIGIDGREGAEEPDFTTPNSAKGKIYDKFEFSVMPSGSIVNLTQVDYFSLPLKITCGSEVRGFNDNITRKQVFDEYLSQASGGWEKLVLKDSSGRKLRILNPAKIAPADSDYFSGVFNCMDAVINEFWTGGKTVTLLTDEMTRRQITGTADGDKVDFGEDGAYVKPSTLQMFGQEVAAGSRAEIVKWLSCAINRGVIRNADINDQGDNSKFYGGSTASNGGLYNRYAEFFHRDRYSCGGRAYAIAFDDVFGQESTLHVPDFSTVTVKLQPME